MISGALRLFRGGLLGKALGLIREALLAFLFGASDIVAAARVAQTAVLGPMNLLTSDALSGAFLPQQARQLRESPAAASALYKSVQTMFTVAGLLFIPAMLFSGQYWTDLIAPGLAQGTKALASSMIMAMALGAPWYVHFNMLAYLEMAHGKYRLSSIRSTGQSLGLIAGVLSAYLLGQPTLIAWGFTFTYVVMCIGGFFYIKKLGYFANRQSTSWSELWLVSKPFLSRIRILMVLPIMALAVDITEKIVSSAFGAATLASIDYARLVTETCVLLLAMPIGLASLSSFAVMSDGEAHSKTLRVLKPLLIVALVMASLITSFSPTIVKLLYQRGAFDAASVSTTSSVLAGLSLGLWAQLSNYFALKVLNARSRNTVAVVAVVVGATLTILIRPLLAGLLGPFGIGLAISLGFVMSLTVCLVALKAMHGAIQCILVSLPPITVCACAGFVARDWDVMSSLSMALIVSIVWILYLTSIPSTRAIILEVIRSIRKK